MLWLGLMLLVAAPRPLAGSWSPIAYSATRKCRSDRQVIIERAIRASWGDAATRTHQSCQLLHFTSQDNSRRILGCCKMHSAIGVSLSFARALTYVACSASVSRHRVGTRFNLQQRHYSLHRKLQRGIIAAADSDGDSPATSPAADFTAAPQLQPEQTPDCEGVYAVYAPDGSLQVRGSGSSMAQRCCESCCRIRQRALRVRRLATLLTPTHALLYPASPQFVGLSRRIKVSVSVHKDALPELVGSVKVWELPGGTKEQLTAVRRGRCRCCVPLPIEKNDWS